LVKALLNFTPLCKLRQTKNNTFLALAELSQEHALYNKGEICAFCIFSLSPSIYNNKRREKKPTTIRINMGVIQVASFCLLLLVVHCKLE